MKKVYIVMMFQWGVEESHSYLLGCWSKEDAAEAEAAQHVQKRDGKYDAVVYEVEADSMNKRAICTYRGIGFKDRIEGYHIYYSSFWSRILDVWKKI